jgi:hypothetical protein
MASFLQAWTVEDTLFCLREGRIFAAGTHDVAVDRDFYKLQVLTDEDIKLIRWLVVDAATHDLSKRHHTDLLTSIAATTTGSICSKLPGFRRCWALGAN